MWEAMGWSPSKMDSTLMDVASGVFPVLLLLLLVASALAVSVTPFDSITLWL